MALEKTSERTKMAETRLNNAYTKGSIVYPRTEYNYDTHKEFDFYPHPKLSEFDAFSTPLKYKRYPFIKDALPIDMSNHKLATAATLQSTIVWLDKFYDDNLQPLSLKVEKEITLKLDKFYDHLEYLDKTYDSKHIRTPDGNFDVDKLTKDGVVARMKMEIMPFRIPLKPTPKLLARVNKAKQETRRKKRSQEIKNFTGLEEHVVVSSSLDEVIALFQKRNLGIFYFRKKAENLMRERFILRQEQYQEEITKISAPPKQA